MFRNNEGYRDPTAGEAIYSADRRAEELSRCIKLIKAVAGLYGYEIQDRIVLKDRETGRILR